VPGARWNVITSQDASPAVHPELRVKYQMASARVLVDLQDHLLITHSRNTECGIMSNGFTVTVICYPARYMYMHEGGRAGDGFTYDR
jgi:hypothetical protein